MSGFCSVCRFFLTLLLALTSVACSAGFDVSKLQELPEQPPLYRYTIAHRGSLHNGLPDNSIPALKDALAQGVQFLEIDVRLGADGELFIFHDGSLKPENSFSPKHLHKRPIQELAPSERLLVRLDKNKTTPIPTLKEMLEQVRSTDTAALQVDLKAESDALLESVLSLLRVTNTLDRVVIQVRNPDRVARVRSIEPRARILARCIDEAQFHRALAEKVEFVELERWLTADAVRLAHQAGIGVVINVSDSPYDEPHMWEFLRSRGVDSIMTDKPLEAR